MNSVRAIQQLNKRELEAGINPEGSWHTDYRDTAFIYIGGLAFELSEGDIITICSQYGEPVWVKLARDKETGKSRGFAWLKYEDQRSCDLAVDNLGGATVMDRVLRVDHARYKPRDDEDMRDNTMGELDLDPAGEPDGARRKRRRTESDNESDEDRPLLPEEIELERLLEKLDEDDPMKESMVKSQQEKVDAAVKKLKKSKRRDKEKERKRERHQRRDDSTNRERDRDRDRRRIQDVEEDSYHRASRRRDDRSRSRDRADDDEERHAKRRHRDNSRHRDDHRHHDRNRDRKDRDRDRDRDRNVDGNRDRDRDHRRRRYSSDEGKEKRPRIRVDEQKDVY